MRYRIVIPIILAGIILVSLRATELCFDEGRYLSDQELIDSVVGGIVQDSQYPQNKNLYYYASAADFHKQNPHCCSVGKDHAMGWFHAFDRWLGGYYRTVDVMYHKYKKPYDNSVYYSSGSPRTRCGKLLSGSSGISVSERTYQQRLKVSK